MTESNAIRMLREWHTKFAVPILDRPAFPGKSRADLRVALIIEEAAEFETASLMADTTGVADAIGDLLYVVYGAALEWGIPADAILEEVHRSNMTKVWPDGTVKRRDDGKILKPPSYSPAMIERILTDYSEPSRQIPLMEESEETLP